MESQEMFGRILEKLEGIDRRLGAVEKGQEEMRGDVAEVRRDMRGMETRLTQKIDELAVDVGKVLTVITDEAGAQIDQNRRKLELLSGKAGAATK